MGNFSLKVDFDVAVKFSKEESYNRLLSYLEKNRLRILQKEAPESLLYESKMSLLSFPREFLVNFVSTNENECILKVNVDCNQFDYGLSKKMFSKITEQIYGVKVV